MSRVALNRRPEPGERWGLLGGAFDPIHYGHLALAEDVAAAAGLTGVLFLPSFQPPHRKAACEAGWEDRLSMLTLAIEAEPTFLAEPIEKELQPPGYTLHVARALKARYSSVDLALIIGADNLSRLAGWYQPEKILDEISILVGSRPGFEPTLPPNLRKDRITVYPTRQVDVSASSIRQTVRNGTSLEVLSGLTPEPVARYIIAHGLYR